MSNKHRKKKNRRVNRKAYGYLVRDVVNAASSPLTEEELVEVARQMEVTGYQLYLTNLFREEKQP